MLTTKIKNHSGMFDLSGKACLITGGAGLIGNAFSSACAYAGAVVIIVDVDEVRGNALAKKINQKNKRGGRAVFKKCDITNEGDVARLVKNVLLEHKNIDVLVNNAFPRTKSWGNKFEEVSYKDFCDNLNMHAGGYFLITREVAKIMKKQKHGTIVNMGSIYGSVPPRFDIYEDATYGPHEDRQHMKGKKMTLPVEYSAIKGAVVNLTKYWASYLGKYNIRVNSISPGGVFDNQPKSFVERYSKHVVLGGRMANVDDLTGVLIFLLSDAARYITGQNIVVDGGWSL